MTDRALGQGHHLSAHIRSRYNYTLITLINDEQVSVSVDNNPHGTIECNSVRRPTTRHCRSIQLSWSKQLNPIISPFRYVQIQALRHKDSIWRAEHIRSRPIASSTSSNSQCTWWCVQWFLQHLIMIIFRTVEVVVEIDQQTSTWWRNRHGRRQSRTV